MSKVAPCKYCGQSIRWERAGTKDDGSVRWKPMDAKSGEHHSQDICQEIQRVGNGNSNTMTKEDEPGFQVKLIERDKVHTQLIVEDKWVIDLRKLNNGRMA